MSGAADAEVFEAHRDLMFAVAYRMLGSVADAEDAVQDAWLRWSAAPRSDIAEPRAYLSRVITNTALNRLRSARTRREIYVGPWLPEPVLTEASPGAGERAELAESVSVAMLVVLESLTPEERAAFVLRGIRLQPRGDRHRARAHRPRDPATRASGTRACPGTQAAVRCRSGPATRGDPEVPRRCRRR